MIEEIRENLAKGWIVIGMSANRVMSDGKRALYIELEIAEE